MTGGADSAADGALGGVGCAGEHGRAISETAGTAGVSGGPLSAYFFSSRHRVVRLMPRRLAAAVWLPPVSSSTRSATS